MVHPELAAADPLYWPSLAIFAAAALAFVCAYFPWFPPKARSPTIIASFIVAGASGSYALIGSACYISGSCL